MSVVIACCCAAVTQIHKTGSTTFHNIVCRFALTRHLKVALFTSIYGKPFPDTCRPHLLFEVIDEAGGNYTRYNVACDHARYDTKYPYAYMAADTVSVSLVREPFSRLKSAFRYFGLTKQLGLSHYAYPLYEYLLRVNQSLASSKCPLWTRNTQMYTFGWPDIHNNSVRAARRYIRHIDAKFDLVLTLERFPESLVLMRRRYGWTTRDIMHSMNNVRAAPRPSVPRDAVRLERARAIDRRFSRVDYVMYEYFANKLDAILAKQPPDFQHEVAYFKSLNSNVTSQCRAAWGRFSREAHVLGWPRDELLKRLRQTVVARVAAARWHDAFALTMLDCRLMLIDTLYYQNALRVRQFPGTCHRPGGPPVRQPVHRNHLISDNWCRPDINDTYSFSLEALMGREKLL